MSEELEKLKRFSPVVVNRDAILFEAGRASARPGSYWKWLAIALLMSHLGWVAIWFWPTQSAKKPEVVEQPATAPEPEPPVPSSYLAMWRDISQSGELAPVSSSNVETSDEEPLRAFSRRLPD
jgi:hypothetical protein